MSPRDLHEEVEHEGAHAEEDVVEDKHPGPLPRQAASRCRRSASARAAVAAACARQWRRQHLSHLRRNLKEEKQQKHMKR